VSGVGLLALWKEKKACYISLFDIDLYLIRIAGKAKVIIEEPSIIYAMHCFEIINIIASPVEAALSNDES
jgi:hypothetical protein